ncbi:MAG: STAS domain-containing protein [Pseudanabaena sp. ELA607]|jgi:anti-anti-sigma factor
MVIMPMEEYLMPMGTLGALKYQDKLTRQTIQHSVVMTLPDIMDYQNFDCLRDFLMNFFSTHSPKIILFDVSNVQVMDSRGLGVLIYAMRTATMRQIQVIICGNPNPCVADLLCLCLAKLKCFDECAIS